MTWKIWNEKDSFLFTAAALFLAVFMLMGSGSLMKGFAQHWMESETHYTGGTL